MHSREVRRVYQAPRPQLREARAPRMYAAPHAFMAPRREVREVRTLPVQRRFARRAQVVRSRFAPFVQYAHVMPHRARVRAIIASPLMRAVYVPRRRISAMLYHPALLTGRVMEIRRNQLVLQPLTGSRIVVNRYIPNYRRYRVNQFATVPAVYNGAGSYAYACSPQYYPQVAQYYANYYGTQVAYVNGCYVPQTAQTAYYNDAYAPSYGYGYAQPYPYASTYGTPYDSCMWSSDEDNDGDGYCGADGGAQYNAYPSGYGAYGNTGYPDPYGYNRYPSPYGYNGYPDTGGYNGYPVNGPYGAYGQYGGYAMQQVQGLVVAKTGTTLMVLGGNGLKPIFVNAGPAIQSGYAVNGPVAVGQVINAYGFYSGDMFVATALI